MEIVDQKINKKLQVDRDKRIVLISQNWIQFQTQKQSVENITKKYKKIVKGENKHKQKILANESQLKFDVNAPLQNSFIQATPHIAIDCEMVNCQDNNKQTIQALARISIINYNGHILIDQYYKPSMRIVNYLTQVSGITYKHICDAPIYDQKERNRILCMLKDKIIVGHSLNNDFKALGMEQEKFDIRDISRISMMRLNNNPQSLKKLCQIHLGQSIQDGSHSSVVDARSAMFIYRRHKNQIDEEVRQMNQKNLVKLQNGIN